MTATTTSRALHRADLDDPELIRIIDAIEPSGTARRHRKGWEQAITILAFERGGVLDVNGRCLSVAAGHEMILYYLTTRFEHVVATDLYADADAWAANEGDLAMLVDPARYSPIEFDRRRLIACHCDALDLRFPDGMFDASYSLSSIEHVGGWDGAVRMLGEMARVTRAGGVVAITTEVVCDGGPGQARPGLELFTPEALRELGDQEPRLEWLDEVDLDPKADGTVPIPIIDAIHLRSSGFDVPEHLRVRAPDGRVFTSVCLAFRRIA